MALKAAVADIIGKTIKHIVVKEGDRQPRSQVFLVFTDGSYYELCKAHGLRAYIPIRQWLVGKVVGGNGGNGALDTCAH